MGFRLIARGLTLDIVEFFKRHFSFRGRAGRATYWKYQLLDGFGAPLLIIGIVWLDLATRPDEAVLHPLTGFWIIAIVLFASVSETAVTVRRLHDLDMSAWKYLSFFVPVYGFYLSLLLGFRAGTEGDNRYGPAPGEARPERSAMHPKPVQTA